MRTHPTYTLLTTLAVVSLFTVLSLEAGTGGKPGKGPGWGTGLVSDEYSPGIGSDGKGIYVNDEEECVSVAVGSGDGFYQIRTVKNNDRCNSQTGEQRRYLTVDFGLYAHPDLDLEDVSSVENIPARFIARRAFSTRAETTGTPVDIHVLQVNGDGTTTQETAWLFRYQNWAAVSINPNGSRRISLGPEEATADLFEIVLRVNPKNGKVRTQEEHRGTFVLPFDVLAERQ